eukprot:TRINITY_DN1187_c2_g3_i1.p1 TRINITY_DN1187_c2_g3~~TRINITY_DN1187_c2_g3_i1.p1  ORF type:complete len:160 (+),score=76.91 TRINITY_DN1187_c2_g3_i1:45-482(+)
MRMRHAVALAKEEEAERRRNERLQRRAEVRNNKRKLDTDKTDKMKGVEEEGAEKRNPKRRRLDPSASGATVVSLAAMDTATTTTTTTTTPTTHTAQPTSTTPTTTTTTTSTSSMDDTNDETTLAPVPVKRTTPNKKRRKRLGLHH